VLSELDLVLDEKYLLANTLNANLVILERWEIMKEQDQALVLVWKLL